ncbi:glycosyltransferase family 2 protein [Thermodesulfobacteriota bacterium]
MRTDYLKPVFNDINRGFAGGNNDGGKEAEGDIVILLNNDTIVPQGAVNKLINHMRRNPGWGMLGPVTNAAGNEQKIYVEKDDAERAIIEGEKFCSHSMNDCFPSERLDFFCVAVRKDLYNSLGGLDEQFGLGYYEDLDFSVRANRAGVKMLFAEDCFIFHGAGKTFSNEGKKSVKKLMHENKRKLKKKYSGKGALFRLRDRNMRIMKEYMKMKKQLTPERKLDMDYKFNNRFLHAKGMYPHSPLKKLLYAFQLKKLNSEYSRI